MERTLLLLIISIHSFFCSFIHSFIHALTSMLKTEMHFLKRFTQSAHLIFAFVFPFAIFYSVSKMQQLKTEKIVIKNCRENHNAMVTIVICIIRTCVLRNERLFSGSSDSLNRALALRPFPFEIRHMHTQSECTFRLIISLLLSLPLPSSSTSSSRSLLIFRLKRHRHTKNYAFNML